MLVGFGFLNSFFVGDIFLPQNLFFFPIFKIITLSDCLFGAECTVPSVKSAVLVTTDRTAPSGYFTGVCAMCLLIAIVGIPEVLEQRGKIVLALPRKSTKLLLDDARVNVGILILITNTAEMFYNICSHLGDVLNELFPTLTALKTITEVAVIGLSDAGFVCPGGVILIGFREYERILVDQLKAPRL
jgi:hypothetical protein